VIEQDFQTYRNSRVSDQFLGAGQRCPKSVLALNEGIPAKDLFKIVRKSAVNISRLSEQFDCILFLKVSLMLLKDQIVRGRPGYLGQNSVTFLPLR
jgi:hypothetical protein